MKFFSRSFRRFIVAMLALGLSLLPFPKDGLLILAGSFIPDITSSVATKSAATTLTFTFTPTQAITGGANVNVNFWAPPDSQFGILGAQVATGSSSVFTSIERIEPERGSISINASALPAQALTLKLSGIVNAPKDGRYTVQMSTFGQGGQIDQGMGSVTVGTIAVQGRVVLPNGTGAVGVWVSANDPSDYSQQHGGNTANDGTFAIGGLTAGKTYSLQTSVNAGMDPNSNVDGFTAADPVSITYAGTVLTQNFTLKVASKTISGRILRSNGQPVASGRVAIMRLDKPTFNQAETDANGYYTAKVSGGKYEVRPDTYAGPGTQNPPDYAYSGPGVNVKFASDDTAETSSGNNFTVINATATIKGSVSPNPGSNVGIGVYNKSGFNTGTGLENGAFSVKVPPGTYEMGLWMDPSKAGDKYSFPDMTPVTVGDGETKNLGAISLVKMDKTISATVREKTSKKGISGFQVGCFKPRGSGFAMGQTNSSGVATIKVTEGEWGCMAMSGNGMKGEGKETGLREWVDLAAKVYAAESGAQAKYVVQGGPKFVKISGTTAATLTFDAVEADRTISVKVVDSNGSSISVDGFVEAELVSSSVGTGFDGGSLGEPIDPNQPGVVELSVPAGIYDLRMMTPPGSNYSSGDATRVDVTSANASATIKLLLNDSTISGILKDEDGNTVKNVFAFVTATNKKGAFIPGDVDPTTGTYSLRAAAAGGSLNLGYYVEPDSGYFPQPFGDSTVTPKSGETVTKHIVMKKATVTVNVTVKDPDGNAVKGAFVEADNRKADSSSKIDAFFHNGSETGSDGKVTLRLPAGDFTLDAFLPPDTLKSSKWMPPKGEAITVAKGDTKDVTLTFQKAEVEVEGTVTSSSTSAQSFSTQATSNVSEAFVTAYSDKGESITTATDSNGKYSFNLTSGNWHIVAEKDATSSGSTTVEPLLSTDTSFNTGTDKKITKNLTVEDRGSLSTTVTSSFDTDNSKVVNLNDGDLKGAQVSLPADALDSDSQGSNATVTVKTTVELPRQLSDKPIGNIALDVSATGSTGSPITSLMNSSTAITIPVKKSDFTAAGFSVSDVGKTVTMSYYDETNGKWAPLDGSITATLKDNTGDGDTDDDNDLVMVTGNTSHFTSFAVTAATDTTAPSAPTSVSATDAATGGKISLAWTNPTDSDFAKIKIYRSTTSGTVGSAITTISSKTTTSYDDSSLDNGTTYYYVVRSLDSSGNESTNTTQVSAIPSGSTTTTLPKTGENQTGILWLAILGAVIIAGGVVEYRKMQLKRQ